MTALLDIQRRVHAALSGANDGGILRAPEGLAVHRRNIAGGLAAALAGTFPAVQRILGARRFHDLARAFCEQAPPREPVLSRYGGGFAEFLGRTTAATLPFLADLARLEWARQESALAADAAPLDAQALDTNDPEAMAGLRFILHPATRLTASPFPVFSLWVGAEVDGGDAETVLTTRGSSRLLTRVITPGDAALMDAIGAGKTLAEAAGAALAKMNDFDLAAALAAHFAAGTFTGVGPASP